MSDPNETISPAEARKAPTGRRAALTVAVAKVAEDLAGKQTRIPPTPNRLLAAKLARLVIGGAVLIVAYRTFDGALTLMLKADTLRVVDCVRVGLGLVLALAASYIVTPDRTVAGLKIAQALALSWKRPPP